MLSKFPAYWKQVQKDKRLRSVKVLGYKDGELIYSKDTFWGLGVNECIKHTRYSLWCDHIDIQEMDIHVWEVEYVDQFRDTRRRKYPQWEGIILP